MLALLTRCARTGGLALALRLPHLLGPILNTLTNAHSPAGADRFPRAQVQSINELRNGDSDPPVTRKEIEYACGRSLGRPLKLRGNDKRSAMVIDLNEYLEKRILFMRLEDGLGEKADGALGAPPPSMYKLPPSAARKGGSHYQATKR